MMTRNRMFLLVSVLFITFLCAGCIEEKNFPDVPANQQSVGQTSQEIDQELLEYYNEFLVFISETTTEEQLYETEKARYNPENLDLIWTHEITAGVNQDNGTLLLKTPPGTFYYGAMRIEAMDSNGNLILNSTESPVYITGERSYETIPGVTQVTIYTLQKNPLS